jgi:hypothetical protein
MHEVFEAERAKQLTEKERKSLSEALYRLAIHEREDVHGALLKTNAGDLTYEEIAQLCIKIFGDRYPVRKDQP